MVPLIALQSNAGIALIAFVTLITLVAFIALDALARVALVTLQAWVALVAFETGIASVPLVARIAFDALAGIALVPLIALQAGVAAITLVTLVALQASLADRAGEREVIPWRDPVAELEAVRDRRVVDTKLAIGENGIDSGPFRRGAPTELKRTKAAYETAPKSIPKAGLGTPAGPPPSMMMVY